MAVVIIGFVYDEANEEKFAAHGITIEQVDQVLDNPHVVVPNRRGRRAPIMIVGRDNGHACIAIPAEPAYHDGYWRPVTAWYCKAVEEEALKRVE
jgi:uncharacterized DUF497 family protein